MSTQVVSFHTVKPLDEDFLQTAFSKFKKVVTIEEHSLVGGFGSAVAEWAVDTGVDSRKLLRIAAPDKFFKLSGSQQFARDQLGLTASKISARICQDLQNGHFDG